LSGVFGSRNTTFRKLDLFPSSGEGWGEKTSTQLGPSERANLSLSIADPVIEISAGW
jgi:hypothetical protein